jgi:hypothetical protein
MGYSDEKRGVWRGAYLNNKIHVRITPSQSNIIDHSCILLDSKVFEISQKGNLAVNIIANNRSFNVHLIANYQEFVVAWSILK